MNGYKPIFPYFGGKSRISSLVWERFGDVPNYSEPFFGSGAVLFMRPDAHRWWERTETVNDKDGMISNFWRAVGAAPDAVARWADWPVNENDLHARHAWLMGQKDTLQARLEGSPDCYDVKVAGWWLWGICQWIGSGWCSGNGPWHVVDGELSNTKEAGGVWRKLPHLRNDGMGINRQRPHLGDDGMGINRQLPHLGDDGMGINRQLPHLRNDGMGINRQLPHLGDDGRGINRKLPHLRNDGMGLCEATTVNLQEMIGAASDRLRRVRVCCGDWSRICGPSPTYKLGITGVFLDPPYSHAERQTGLYTHDEDVAAETMRWAVEQGQNPLLRIALCGYEGEHDMPADWECVEWTPGGGYGVEGNGRGRENRARERVWFSPHCLKADTETQLTMGLAL